MATSVGLDIGLESIKAVELTDDYKLAKICRVEIPRPITGDENEVYATKIKELFQSQKLSRDNVIISIRGSNILTRTYLPPSSSKDNFEQWFVENIESLIPGAPINDVMYSHQFLSSGRVLISFARLREIENTIKTLNAAGIFPMTINASCLALFYAFEKHHWTKNNKNFAIVDISGLATEVLLVRRNEPFASAELAFGGRDVKKGNKKHQIYIHALAAKLTKLFDFYKNKDNFESEKLILVGDYARISGLKSNLSNMLDIKTIVGNPFRTRKIKLPSRLRHNHYHSYSQALGLAIKGLNREGGINLMPPEIKQTYRFWRFNKMAKNLFKKNIIVSSFTLFILIILLSIAINDHRRIAREVDELRLKKNELSYITNEERELNSQLLKLRQLNNDRFMWSQILFHLGSAVPKGIYLKEVSTESRMVSAGNRLARTRKLVIEGDAQNNEMVIKFIRNLEGYFDNIVVNKIKQESRCHFKISLKL